MAKLEFEWKVRKIEEWRMLLLRVPRTNYLQSVPFARAVLESDRKVTKLAVILEDGKEVGMMALQEICFGPFHIVNLYRGPLWFDEVVPESRLIEFAKLFNGAFPRRPLRFRRWIPEWKDSELLRRALFDIGFRPKAKSYETIYLDLSLSEAELRGNLRSNWRNHLGKGERADLRISVDWSGKTAKLFLHKYDLDRKQRKYFGRSKKFMRSEMSTALAYKEMVVLWAVHGSRSVAAIMVLIHGNSASYRLGWTTDAGREVCAHNVLLWEAVKLLKQKSVRYFDLVGVEPETAEGLTKFKRGMGGEDFKTLGLLS